MRSRFISPSEFCIPPTSRSSVFGLIAVFLLGFAGILHSLGHTLADGFSGRVRGVSSQVGISRRGPGRLMAEQGADLQEREAPGCTPGREVGVVPVSVHEAGGRPAVHS